MLLVVLMDIGCGGGVLWWDYGDGVVEFILFVDLW